MAQLISKTGKAAPAVDLTPMVDLGFLLISFFMFTTTLSKPFAMEVQMPYKDNEHKEPSLIKENTAMTILLGKDHQVYYYYGMPDDNLKHKVVLSSFEGRDNIRVAIGSKKTAITQLIAAGGLEADDKLTVLIKASDKSTTDDLVKILDEMSVSRVLVYAVADISTEELALIE